MSMFGSQLPRRALAVVCALAFLAVGFAHNIHHFDNSIPTAAIHSDGGSAGDTDTSKKAPVALEHCHGCSMIAMSAAAQPATASRIPSVFPSSPADEQLSHPPVVEIPPPISLI
ncbi:MAG TPA: hypothetical protein VI251_17090 [Pseudolabrys sp.]